MGKIQMIRKESDFISIRLRRQTAMERSDPNATPDAMFKLVDAEIRCIPWAAPLHGDSLNMRAKGTPAMHALDNGAGVLVAIVDSVAPKTQPGPWWSALRGNWGLKAGQREASYWGQF